MSSNFVRYSPEIETIDPDLDEYMTRIIDFREKTVRESPEREGSGRAVRGARAKTLGVAKAEVEILGYVPAPYAQGIYAKPGHHGALIRFSSASNHLGPDALGEIMKVRQIYSTSAKMRRSLNHQPQNEPTSADEVLPLPKLFREEP